MKPCMLIAGLTTWTLLLHTSAGPASSNRFTDVTEAVGLSGVANSVVAWCDFDCDGWADLFCANTLWKNMHGERFEKVKNLPKQMTGSGVWGDYDNDGFPDFFNFKRQKLFHNEKGTGFRNVSKLLPTVDPMTSVSATWSDFDNDGFLDLYIGGYEVWEKQITYPDLILMNRGGTSFELTWKNMQRRARSVISCDFDQDNDLDIYVSNYRLQPNFLWINDGKGNLSDKASRYDVVGTERSWSGGHSIGSCWGDFDNDGLFDLFSGNFSHRGERWGKDHTQPESDFFRNKGLASGYRFKDLGTCGLEWQESYASPAVGDFDNDGFLDLSFSTVYSPDQSVLYQNNGDWTFSDVTEASGVRSILGTTETYQNAWADYDNDGDLDLMSGGRLMRNSGNDNAWLKVRLKGSGSVNSMAIGTQVRLMNGTSAVTRQVEGSTGQGNVNDHVLHFGLGFSPSLPLEMEIRWTDGTEQQVLVQAVNQSMTIKKKL